MQTRPSSARNSTLRSDLSCTIFLNDPASYEGGALRIQLGTREERFRGAPGSAIVYPSTTMHEVEAVTKGERFVAITFIQSRIADGFRRELLYELNEVAALEGLGMAPENFARLQLIGAWYGVAVAQAPRSPATAIIRSVRIQVLRLVPARFTM